MDSLFSPLTLSRPIPANWTALGLETRESTISSICQEIRNPLTTIRGVLGLFHSGKLNSESIEGQRLLNMAIQNSNRLVRLISALENTPDLLVKLFSEEEIEKIQLETDLHHALERQELFLVYQPIIDLETQAIASWEALIRWKHSSKGLISPQCFIPLAEKTGFIHELGLWILETVCQQIKVWQSQMIDPNSLTISINLSALQLAQTDLADQIKSYLDRYEVAPSCLRLEITETALMENSATAVNILNQLVDLGIELDLDDFGIGYSSLSRLQYFPISTLKIDRSFTQNQQWQLCHAIIVLAKKLGLETIAEGIETSADLDQLRKLGCSKIQGYYFSKPLDAEKAIAFQHSQAELFTPE